MTSIYQGVLQSNLLGRARPVSFFFGAGRKSATGAVAVPRYCAEADAAPCGLLPCEVGPGAGNGRLGGRGAPPSEATKERNTELFFSASWPAEMTMSTCSGGSLHEVSTALRADARWGSS